MRRYRRNGGQGGITARKTKRSGLFVKVSEVLRKLTLGRLKKTLFRKSLHTKHTAQWIFQTGVDRKITNKTKG